MILLQTYISANHKKFSELIQQSVVMRCKCYLNHTNQLKLLK